MGATELSIGAFGKSVTTLQNKLRQMGLTIPAAEIQRGFFGPATKQALLQFQQIKGLPATGRVDQQTASLLQAILPEPAPTIRSTSPGTGITTAAGERAGQRTRWVRAKLEE
jgi:peptidoglycan hydrolase-like protein with peptidoglycan-binding domain